MTMPPTLAPMPEIARGNFIRGRSEVKAQGIVLWLQRRTTFVLYFAQ